MSKRIQIDFSASTVELDEAGKRVSMEVERIGDSASTAMENLGEVADKKVRAYLEHQKELGRTGEDVGRELGKAALEGDRQARQLRNSIEREAREIRKAFDDTGDAAHEMADDVGEAAGGMQLQLTDVTALVGQLQGTIKSAVEGNISEAINSGSTAIGSFVSTINPLVGGAIAAVGGLGAGLLNNFTAHAEEVEAKSAEVFQNMISNGRAALDEAQIMATYAEIVTENGERMQAALALEDAGFATAAEALRALSGDAEAAAEISSRVAVEHEKLTTETERLVAAREQLGPMADPMDIELLQDEAIALAERRHELETLTSSIDLVTDALDTGRERYRLYEAGMKVAEDRAKAATEQHAAMYDAIDRLPDSKTIGVDADTDKAMTALDAMRRRAESMVLRVRAEVVDQYGRAIE